jgi:biotin transporter BioY
MVGTKDGLTLGQTEGALVGEAVGFLVGFLVADNATGVIIDTRNKRKSRAARFCIIVIHKGINLMCFYCIIT